MIITLQTCPKKKSKGNSPSTGQLDSKDKFKLKNLCIKRYRTHKYSTSVFNLILTLVLYLALVMPHTTGKGREQILGFF